MNVGVGRNVEQGKYRREKDCINTRMTSFTIGLLTKREESTVFEGKWEGREGGGGNWRGEVVKGNDENDLANRNESSSW